MSSKKLLILLLFCFISVNINSYAYASEIGGKQETALNNKIDTQNLSGVDLLIVNLYNNDRILYAVVVTLVMASLGSIMAFGTDLVLKFFGMNVTKISHKE
jgi:hypothetical protein